MNPINEYYVRYLMKIMSDMENYMSTYQDVEHMRTLVADLYEKIEEEPFWYIFNCGKGEVMAKCHLLKIAMNDSRHVTKDEHVQKVYDAILLEMVAIIREIMELDGAI